MEKIPGGARGVSSAMLPPRGRRQLPCARGYAPAAARGRASEPLPCRVVIGGRSTYPPVDGRHVAIGDDFDGLHLWPLWPSPH